MSEPSVTEVAPVETAPSAEIQPDTGATLSELRGLYNPDLDFRKLALEAAYFSRGFALKSKDSLIGVPFVIVGVTYRDGYLNQGVQGDYVSLECVVADKNTMNSAQVRSQLPGELEVWPNEAIVINDGSTGIRRELTRLFDDIGLIDVGGQGLDDRRYDRPMSQWRSGAELAATGIVADHNGEPFRYIAMRGLRRSDYESPYGPATTFYFG